MRAIRSHIVIAFFVAFAGVPTAWAQSVFWSPSQGTLQQGKANSIDLFYDSCEPTQEPEVPSVPGLDLRFRGRSNSTSIVNGRVSAKVIFNFQAIPSSEGTVVIPSFTVQTSQGEMRVPEARFEVVEATVGSTGVRPDEVFLSRFQLHDDRIYAGEVFQIDYIAGAKQEYQLVDLSEPEWSPEELVTSGLSETQTGSVELEGQRYVAKAYTATAMATESGFVEVPGASQNATVVVGRRRDFLFQEPVYDSFRLESDPFSLEIQPLPEGAPAGFAGAVGEFTLQSRVVPEEVQVGEPVTWTLELSGTGNWPAGVGVPPRSVSAQFKAIQPELKTEFAEDSLFTGKQTEDIVLIPTKEGSFKFGPINYSYFDPKAEEYKTITIPAKTVTVTAATTTGPGGVTSARSGADGEVDDALSPDALSLDPTGDNAATKPPALPREPLAGSEPRALPSGQVDLLSPALLAVGAPVAFWLLLAAVQSVRQDPKRESRAALRKLKKIAKSPLPNDLEAVRELQREWRAAVVTYLGLSAREPSPKEIEQAALERTGSDLAEKWRKLWQQSDRILYSASPADTQAWADLNRETALRSPKPRYSPTLVFRRRSWAGALFTLLSISTLSSADLRADEAQTYYDAGEFTKAEELWVEAIDENPRIYELRYNAGLAAAQQSDWGRAWAYWAGAFCLEPGDERVAWNLRLAHANTGAYDPVLQSLLEKEGSYRLVRLLSPAGWETLAATSIWIAGGFFLLAIAALYLLPIRRLAVLFLALGLLAMLNAFFSKWAAAEYEALGRPNALLVTAETSLRSIPSDLSDEQIATEVREGTIAVAQKQFLGWTKVELANGETGWMRNQGLMPLYGPVSTQSGSR